MQELYKRGRYSMNNKEKSFEEMIEELENIANSLEKDELTLDESVLKFEEGMRLSKECSNILDNAEKRIKILIDENDEIHEEDFSANE